MKVYTEVNYIWKDNKLVQTDSKSYEYEGDVEQCHRKWHWHTHASVNTVVNKVKDTVSKGPGGDIKKVVDKVYGGDTKAAVTSVQETYKDIENSYNDVKDDVAQILFAPVKEKLEETATSIINEKKPTSNVNTQEDDLLYGSRRGMQMQDEGQRASSGGLRRDIHVLRTLSGKAKPKG